MLRIILAISSVQTLAVVMQILKAKLVAVYLGPAGVGVVTMVDQFVQLAAFIVTFNISEYSVKFLSKAHSEGQEAFRNSYAYFLLLLVLASVTGTLLMMGLIVWSGDILGEEVIKYRIYLILGLATIPTYILGSFFTRVIAATQNYNALSVLSFVLTTATVLGGTVGIVLTGILGFYIGSIISGLITVFGIIIFFWKRYSLKLFTSDKFFWRLKQSSDRVSFTTLFYFVAVTNAISYLAARYVVFTNFGEAEAGFMHASLSLSLAIGLILNPAVKFYFAPLMNRNTENNVKIHQAIRFQKRMIILLSLASLPIALFPQLLLKLLFTSEFVVISQLIYIFVLSQFIFLVAYINLTLLIGLDEIKWYAATYLLSLVLFSFLTIFLVPLLGSRGVAYGHIISSILLFILTLFRLRQKYRFMISLNSWLLLGYTVAVLMLIGQINRNTFFSELNINLFIIRVCMYFLFLMSLYLFLDNEEKQSFQNFKDRFLRMEI